MKQYDAHASYQFEKAMRWLEEADAIVFCGTSFSVRLTDMCFEVRLLTQRRRVTGRGVH